MCAVLTAVLALVCVFASGCGGGESGAGGEAGSGTERMEGGAFSEAGDGAEGAAYEFVRLLAGSDTEYYMKAEVVTEIPGENGATKDIVESAQAKDRQMISSESNSYIQYYLSGRQYYYDTLTMKYYELGAAGRTGAVDQAFAPVTGYKETKDAEFGGRECKCDVYENETVYDGTKVLMIMEYYVADGKLAGIVSKQRYRADEKLISKVTMTIKEFTTDIPEGTFDPPSGFEKVE